MATNEVFRDADHLSLPVPDGTKSGDAVRVGGLNGVAQTAKGEGGNVAANATVWLKGAHVLPVSTTSTLSVGQAVYMTAAGVLTPAATAGEDDNALFGHALTAKGAAAGPVTVRVAN